MKINHQINKKEGTVTVKVSLTPIINRNKIRVTTRQIVTYLTENKIKIKECIQGCVVSNVSKNLSGKWVFKLDIPARSVVSLNDEKSKDPSVERKTKRQSKTNIPKKGYRSDENFKKETSGEGSTHIL